jgi:hypothetical protein
MIAVILQGAQVVIGNLGIGRVDVGDVGVAGGEGPVGKIVLDPAYVALRQIVGRLQARPPVLARMPRA